MSKYAMRFSSSQVPRPASPFLKNFWPLVYLVSCVVLYWEWRPFIKPLEFRYLLVAGTGAVLFSIIIVSFIFRLEQELKK